MGRSFQAFDLVQLPHLDAGSAQTLATSVVTVGKKAKLSAGAKGAYADVVSGLRALEEAVRRRLPATGPSDGQRAKQADMVMDAAWSGTFDWLNGWAKMPFLREAALAAKVRDQLFPDGLKFILVAYRVEWAESKTRLELIKEKKLEPVFDKLGGAPILKSLREAHKAYGDALNITAASEAEEGMSVRDALADLLDALRTYVVQVSAMVQKKDPKSAKLAEKLLAPIMEWESSGGGRATGAEPDPNGDGADVPNQAPAPQAAAPGAAKKDPLPA